MKNEKERRAPLFQFSFFTFFPSFPLALVFPPISVSTGAKFKREQGFRPGKRLTYYTLVIQGACEKREEVDLRPRGRILFQPWKANLHWSDYRHYYYSYSSSTSCLYPVWWNPLFPFFLLTRLRPPPSADLFPTKNIPFRLHTRRITTLLVSVIFPFMRAATGMTRHDVYKSN